MQFPTPNLYELLIDFVRGSSWISNLTRIIEDELKELRDAVTELKNSVHIEAATKDALDKHGANIDLERRPGETDKQFKQRIGLEGRINRSNGTIEDIQNLLVSTAWVEAGEDWTDEKVRLEEFHDLGRAAFFRFYFDYDQLVDIGLEKITNVVNRAKPAGVRGEAFAVGEFGYSDAENPDKVFENIEGYDEGRYSGLL